MAMTMRPKVMAMPTWVTPPPVSLSMTMAPVPQKTRAKVPISSEMDFLIIYFRFLWHCGSGGLLPTKSDRRYSYPNDIDDGGGYGMVIEGVGDETAASYYVEQEIRE